MIEIWHWEPNTFFLKPLIALHEKQARFTSRYFDASGFEQLARGFPANLESTLHLEREGPVLVDGQTVISSSFFMLEYIAEAVPGPDLRPRGAYEHYRAQALAQFVALTLAPLVCALGCARYLAPELAKRDQRALKASIESIQPQERRDAWAAVVNGTYDNAFLAAIRERLKPALHRFEAALTGSQWLAGADYSIADIDAFAMINPLRDLAPDVVSEPATPRILDFLSHMRERPAVKAALAMSKTGNPQHAFVPGPEASRWG